MSTIEITIGDPFNGPPVNKVCQVCDKRQATLWWSEEGSALAISHGHYEARCERCVVTAQLRHAEDMATSIPTLRARLRELIALEDK